MCGKTRNNSQECENGLCRQSRCKIDSQSHWRRRSRIDAEGRECVACLEYKPWNEFYKRKTSARGYHHICKACLEYKPWNEFHKRKTDARDHHHICKAHTSRQRGVGETIRRGLLNAVHETARRAKRWENLVGYTADELKAHLEAQFTGEMRWSNYGEKWFIDHRLPKSHFDVSLNALKEYWALNNLQPLWRKNNS